MESVWIHASGVEQSESSRRQQRPKVKMEEPGRNWRHFDRR
jgi:hypothetical protein